MEEKKFLMNDIFASMGEMFEAICQASEEMQSEYLESMGENNV